MKRSLFFLAGVLAVACIPAFAAIPVAVTPEPQLGILMALGVGAVVVVSRKLKGR